jgi:hypothetical protein
LRAAAVQGEAPPKSSDIVSLILLQERIRF